MTRCPQTHFLLIASCTLLLTACEETANQHGADESDAHFSVYVVNYPLEYFAERIGAERIVVHFPAPADVDPATWHPPDEVVRRYQQADLVLINGADYAHWVRHASLPQGARVNTAAAYEDRLLEVPDAVVHSHGNGHAHAHSGVASRTWLNLTLAVEQARAVKSALAERMPEYADEFERRFNALAEELEQLDRQLAEAVDNQSDVPLLAAYALYHYLQDRYDLNLVQIEWERGRTISEHDWAQLNEVLQGHDSRWMLWDEQPSPEVVDRLAEHGIEVVVYNPVEQPPEEGDFMQVMQQNAERLGAAFADRGND